MRIVALEEHYTVPRIVAGISPDAIARRGFPGPDFVWAQTTKRNELADLGRARLDDMDASGITVQVLSVAGPGADLVPGQPGIDLARAYNDALAEACARHPDRYRGFAHLPMLAPEAAADELERTVKDLGFHGVLVNGATDGRFLDDPIVRADPGESRDARPADLPPSRHSHPGRPYRLLRRPAGQFQLHHGAVRLGLARRYRDPHAPPRAQRRARPPSRAEDRHRPHGRGAAVHAGPHRRNHQPPRRRRTCGARCGRRSSIRCGSPPAGSSPRCPSSRRCMSFGVDRIMFSVDYPFASNARARAFLDALPVSPADRAKIAHGNADRLLRLPG